MEPEAGTRIVSEPPTRILVCADDFGMHPAIDQAVFALAERGRLSGASCLVDGPAFARDAGSLLASGLQCGLHLNFTDVLTAPGLYMPLTALIRSCWLRRLDPAAVTAHIVHQFDRYETVMGRAPDYIDGHQHVHQFPVIREALLDVIADRYARGPRQPWLRSTRRGRQAGLPASTGMKAWVIEALGAGSMRKLATARGLVLNTDFQGVYGFEGGEAGYAALLKKWLAEAGPGTLIMCHPAAAAVPGDPLGAQRIAEFRTWMGDRVGQWLAEFGLEVTRHVPVSAAAPA